MSSFDHTPPVEKKFHSLHNLLSSTSKSVCGRKPNTSTKIDFLLYFKAKTTFYDFAQSAPFDIIFTALTTLSNDYMLNKIDDKARELQFFFIKD